ncbi:MAG: rRNA maturation RNase YbeY [Patescibacteria group bacterium]
MKHSKLIEEIKAKILGPKYELSFVFVAKNKIRALNKKFRNKNEPTDILSFPLSKTSGEILICREIAKLKSTDFNMKPQSFLIFLVIHGMLHLKGMKHGAKMEKYELSYYSRYRRRHL